MLKRNKKAFSLIELSIVTIIVGILISGITQSSRLIELYKLSAAKTQTQSSPVNAIKNLVAWYEPTLEASFNERETDNYSDLSDDEKAIGKGLISKWYDISTNTKDNLTQDTIASRPQHLTNCINDLPCVNFDGTDDFLSFDGTAIKNIAGSNYTIFIVEKNNVPSSGEDKLVILGSSANETLNIGYSTYSRIDWGHASGNRSRVNPSNVLLEDHEPVLHTFVSQTIDGFSNITSNNNFFYYTNGSAIAESLVLNAGSGVGADVGPLPSYSNATLGGILRNGEDSYYKGAIGEVIVFNRALRSQEKDDVENYLIKKWKIRPDNSSI